MVFALACAGAEAAAAPSVRVGRPPRPLSAVLLGVLAAAAMSSAFAGPLLDAARDGHRDVALKLLAEQADANDRSSDGTTALHWAAHNGDAELVKRLLKSGANARAVNDYGSSPMSEAAERGDAGILEQLLKAGADVESPNAEGQTALMTVARTNHVDAASVLIKHKVNVNAREQWRGQTALMWAAAQGQPEMVQLLIKHKADVNARSSVREWARKVTAEPRPQNRPSGGFTALLLAAREGCVACAEILVTKGKADINLADPANITPLNMALLNGRWDLAASLIKLGADVNRWDTWGRAPLYSAADYNTTPRGGHQRCDAERVGEVRERSVGEQQFHCAVVAGLGGANQRRGAGGEHAVAAAVLPERAIRREQLQLHIRVRAHL